MSYKRHLYNPEARKAEAEMREREAIKDHAYESFALLERVAKECVAPVDGKGPEILVAIHKHIAKVRGGK